MFRRCISAVSFVHRASFSAKPTATATSYKSQYSLDKIYPESSLNPFKPPQQSRDLATTEQFSGVIPLDEIEFRYSRSSGPGGQNVNKVNTKVEIRVHVPSAEWLSQATRENLMQLERNRITKDGYLIISCDKTRKQYLNQAECLDKLRCFIRNAEIPPYEPSPEQIKLIQQRQARAKESILRQKKSHSLKKFNRQKPGSLD